MSIAARVGSQLTEKKIIRRIMTEEPPKKKRKQMKEEKTDSDGGRNSLRATKRVEVADNPTLFPQVCPSSLPNSRKNIIDKEPMQTSFLIMLLYS
jgi:hypothetical protein